MPPVLNLDLPDPEWLSLLKDQHRRGKSVSQIARECEIARPSVSMLISGTYPANSLDLVTRKHGAKIMRLYQNQQMCPHLQRGIPMEDCRSQAAALMSTANPEKLRFWRACRRCPVNPLSDRQESEARA